MNKKILLIMLMIFTVNVNAETNYTEYSFEGYTLNKNYEGNPLYKYEDTILHYFYTESLSNIVYAPKDEIISKSPQIDIDDYIIESKQATSNDYNAIHVVNLLKSTATLNEIVISNLSIEPDANITEIDIFYGDNIVSYRIDEQHNWLNDGDTTIGDKIEGEQIKLSFDQYYSPKILKLYITYSVNKKNIPTYSLEVGQNAFNFNNNEKEIKHLLVEFANSISFNNYKKSGNYIDSFSSDGILINYYTDILNYKHYDLSRSYYFYSDEEYIEGYKYNTAQDRMGYRLYKREIIEEESTQTPTLNEKTSLEIEKMSNESFDKIEEKNSEYIPYRAITKNDNNPANENAKSNQIDLDIEDILIEDTITNIASKTDIKEKIMNENLFSTIKKFIIPFTLFLIIVIYTIHRFNT